MAESMAEVSFGWLQSLEGKKKKGKDKSICIRKHFMVLDGHIPVGSMNQFETV